MNKDVVIETQAKLLEETRKALTALIAAKPLMGAFDYGTDSLGNLRVRLSRSSIDSEIADVNAGRP